MTPPAEKDRRFAHSLAKGLSVLRVFRANDNGLSNAELSRRTGIPKSSITRLTFTLQSLGYLSHDGYGEKYHLGPSVLALGNIASASLSFMTTAETLMQNLADSTGTLVLMAVRDCEKLLLVKTWRPQNTASIWLDVGYRLPLLGSSSGQAILGAMTEAEFRAFCDDCAEADSEPTLKPAEIRRDAHGQMVERGFVIVPQQDRYASTINAVSVPYRSREISEPVVFSCGAMPEILPKSRMENDVGPLLRAAVKELEQITGQPAALCIQ